MSGVDRTLFLPLYGKALVSQQGILLHDPWAETIWAKEAFPLQGRARSRWLAYYMAMRAAVFDRWLKEQMAEHPQALVLHLGCGLDSRCRRVGETRRLWYDADLPQVIAQREKYFPQKGQYHLLPCDLQRT
ncbi:MAG: class I SAM-dependent methyltransferase, partial [Clostridia bacterium]|nr:class I SAM-dependent methyltransferase [Clostridia bacterium]